MTHLTSSQWKSVAFVAAGVFALGLAIVSFLSEGGLADKMFWFSFAILLGLMAARMSGNIHLPWWRDSKKPQ